MFQKEKQNDTKARVHVDSFALCYIFCLLSNPYGLPLSELKPGHLHFLLYINSPSLFPFSPHQKPSLVFYNYHLHHSLLSLSHTHTLKSISLVFISKYKKPCLKLQKAH